MCYDSREVPEAQLMERDGPNATARKIVDAHVAAHGTVPCADVLKNEIAVAISLAELRAANSAKAAVMAGDPD